LIFDDCLPPPPTVDGVDSPGGCGVVDGKSSNASKKFYKKNKKILQKVKQMSIGIRITPYTKVVKDYYDIITNIVIQQ
jgi:hypothetical protein